MMTFLEWVNLLALDKNVEKEKWKVLVQKVEVVEKPRKS